MSESWTKYLHQSRQKVADAGRTRHRRPLDLDGLIDFGSNDYLGLRHHPAVLAALKSADSPLGSGWGAGASPVLSGYSKQHEHLELALAEFSSSAAALVFTSGFACHSGTIACMAGAEDLILSDQLNHASLIDGCRLSRAQTIVYPHRNVDFVRNYLRQHRHSFSKVLLISESIFSMDGDAAPLQELAELAQRFDAGLVVDEAHAVGVFGSSGAGLLEELQLQSKVLVKLGTLSKALGGVGGYVAGEEDLIAYLVNHCRSYLFSTASPGLSLLATQHALHLTREMQTERTTLRRTAIDLRARLREIGLAVPAGNSPIIPLIVGSESRAIALSQHLWQSGIYIPAIRPPTVPVGTCRLRISLSITHTAPQLDRLVTALQQIAVEK